VGGSLIPWDFPALHDLTLSRVQLADGFIFSALAAQASTSLRSLRLIDCSVTATWVKHAATLLAQLPGLQALHVTGTCMPAGFAEHLSGLTSLTISTDNKGLAAQVATVEQNRGLRSLTIQSGWFSGQLLQPDLLQQVLTSCTNLTQLSIADSGIDDQGLYVLLTQGTRITDLTLGGTCFTTSMAGWPCSWRELTLSFATLQEFAYLPLH
jgi:hypothetical protein